MRLESAKYLHWMAINPCKQCLPRTLALAVCALLALASGTSFGQAGMQFYALERCSAGLTISADVAPNMSLASPPISTGSQCIAVPKELGEGKIILAAGQIEKLSSDQFVEFSQSYFANTIVVLQSLGGVLIGGLR